jgi:hypothetical protein
MGSGQRTRSMKSGQNFGLSFGSRTAACPAVVVSVTACLRPDTTYSWQSQRFVISMSALTISNRHNGDLTRSAGGMVSFQFLFLPEPGLTHTVNFGQMETVLIERRANVRQREMCVVDLTEDVVLPVAINICSPNTLRNDAPECTGQSSAQSSAQW